MARLLGNTWEGYDNFFFRPVNDTSSTLPPDVTLSNASIAGVMSGGAGEGLALTLFGNPVATTLKSAGTGAGSESAPALGKPQSVPDAPSSHVSAGLHINLIADASVANAPATFSSEIRQAADLIEAAFSDPITINIRYGWGTYNNQFAPELIGGNFAEGGDIGGQNVDYPTLRSWLTADASSAEDNAAVAHFPGSISSSFHVATAQLKALGHFTGNSNSVDGAIGWGTAWTSNFIDGALHELTHAMGRIFQDGFHYIMDLFRYDAPGHFQWTGRQPAYLSIDGGATRLADFGVTSDFGDFLPGGVQGPDPFNEQVSGNNILTPVDITNMDVIGFNRANGSPRPPADDFANSLSDTTHPFGALGVTGAVTGTLEVTGDRDWFRVSLVAGTTYVINLQGQTGGGGTLEDPYLRVHNTAGAVLAENDDIQLGVNRDSQLVFQAQTTGVYYFEAGAFNDGYSGTYRLRVNSNSDDFANSLADTAHPLGAVPVNGSHAGTLEATGDRDWFGIQLNAGATYEIDLQGLQAGAGTLEDPYLRIHNSSGTLVAENDDIDLGINRDSHLIFQATTTGTYYIEAGAFDDSYTGTYKVSVSGPSVFATPTFELSGFAPGAGGWSSDNTYPRQLADVNGDHMADIVGFGSVGVYVALATGNGNFGTAAFALNSFGAAASAGGWSDDNLYHRDLADVNGDGKADIVGFGSSGVYVALATGNGNFAAAKFVLNSFGAADSAGGWSNDNLYHRDVADVNGDHMADIVGFGSSGVYVALATGNGNFAAATFNLNSFGSSDAAGGWSNDNTFHRELADVNGDGKADIVGFGGAGVYVAPATSNGNFAQAFLAINSFGTSGPAGGWSSQDQFPRHLADINGDHMADIVGFGGNSTFVAFGKSDGSFENPAPDLASFGYNAVAGGWSSNNAYPRELADVTGEGWADIVGFGYSGVYEALSNGFHLV